MSANFDAALAKQSNIRTWMSGCLEGPRIRTPLDIYMEESLAQRAILDRELRSLMGQDPMSDVTLTGDRVVQFAGRLKVLEQEFASTKESKERAFAAEVDEQSKKLLSTLADIVGDSIVDQWVRERRGEKTPTEAHTPSVQPGPERSPETPASPDGNARDEADEQQGSSQSQSQPERGPPRDRQHDRESLNRPQERQPASDHQATHQHRSARKRLASPSGSRTEPEKRARLDTADNERSVDFDDIYQNGEAEIKYTIARYPRKDGKWYILECKEHSQHFTNDPILGAAKHLATPVHDNLPRKHDLAVQILGTLVRNCTPEMVKENNLIAQEAFEKGLGMPPVIRRTRRPQFNGGSSGEPRASAHGGPHTRSSRVVSGMVNPKPGEIYAAYWSSSRNFYPVLILPWGSFEPIGLGGSLLETGLLAEEMPSCYIVDEDGGDANWAEGYEDGGALVSKRKFPVLYFDEAKFPEESSVGWAPVADMKHFDPGDMSIILHGDSVTEFVKSQQSNNPDTIVRVGGTPATLNEEPDILERGEQLNMETLTGSSPNREGVEDDHQEAQEDVVHREVSATPPQETPRQLSEQHNGGQSPTQEAAENGTVNKAPNLDAAKNDSSDKAPRLDSGKEAQPSEPEANGEAPDDRPNAMDDESELENLMDFQPLREQASPSDLITSGDDFLRPATRDSLLESLIEENVAGAAANNALPTVSTSQSPPVASRIATQESILEDQTARTTVIPVPEPRVLPVPEPSSTHIQVPRPEHRTPVAVAAKQPARPLAPKPSISRTPSSPIPASLMPNNDYLQQLAAQAVVSAIPEGFQVQRNRPANSAFTSTPRAFEMRPEHLRAESASHPARRTSGFFNAVLSPQPTFVERNGSASTHARFPRSMP